MEWHIESLMIGFLFGVVFMKWAVIVILKKKTKLDREAVKAGKVCCEKHLPKHNSIGEDDE